MKSVSIGIVNCNRLYYLKACYKSLIQTTKSYTNKEICVIDNCSTEKGTEEFLDEIEKDGVKVIRKTKRDPANEFARALNDIYENLSGEIILMLQGDEQFILSDGWLEKYVELFEKGKYVGCVMIDAQRQVRINSGKYPILFGDDYRFVMDTTRNGISGAGGVLIARKILDKIYPWEDKTNLAHEGSLDSETKMLHKIRELEKNDPELKKASCYMPIVPPAVVIYNEQGTNARIRGNKRYGDYWPPENNFYYEILDFDEMREKYEDKHEPVSIEMLAKPVGWKAPIDDFGNWIKNPIRPETATADQYQVLYEEENENEIKAEDDYLKDWME